MKTSWCFYTIFVTTALASRGQHLGHFLFVKMTENCGIVPIHLKQGCQQPGKVRKIQNFSKSVKPRNLQNRKL